MKLTNHLVIRLQNKNKPRSNKSSDFNQAKLHQTMIRRMLKLKSYQTNLK
jgi:hypothetical protein